MSNNDKNKAQSPDIIEEIIPGKNDIYNDKSINQNSNNNQHPFVENYNEKEAAQSVLEASEESEKNTEKSINDLKNQIPDYTQTFTGMQQQMAKTNREITENFLEYNNQALHSLQTVFMPYFENVYNQSSSNQELFRRMPETYSQVIRYFTENAIAFNRIFNEIMLSNIGFFTNAINEAKEQSKFLIEMGKNNVNRCEEIQKDIINSFSPFSTSLVNQTNNSNFEVDNGRNSDESSTNIEATFSCETCGKTFDSRQDLKEHSSTMHFK
ncbi:C2H2-type zinc finger protein [Candidatus Nitrosocosmicus agrestis]|jgi:molecular chaperone GrpE (heat shock protein)|uniref:C2H2-type zinc finger protein n=1 Tax=Candidatus Nitrosocosmicus agrestis TaxID=2563600 RepID=UPI00122E995D|nr:C2H2-type zinc finger protein [Candidatus Nitrosocosmicus sp. SS]KAA2282994.1 hypothetical protein F1Z66_04850 [Candidatus Nitrosocosmicus sp. SS]KAF0869197.1 hypothetical protein E5N71_07130 [Candidatus Nitrosocosmicus sp. SS]